MKTCPKCKSQSEFKPSLTIRNTVFQSKEGTVSPYSSPILDETALKCPDCGYTIEGQIKADNHNLWNP